ncbi:hypothetical protein G6F59_017288 [Rhizopus arrhizus]|nr:hypothetical protein G6F59_017288 [Rhizopus arrhizus]
MRARLTTGEVVGEVNASFSNRSLCNVSCAASLPKYAGVTEDVSTVGARPCGVAKVTSWPASSSSLTGWISAGR